MPEKRRFQRLTSLGFPSSELRKPVRSSDFIPQYGTSKGRQGRSIRSIFGVSFFDSRLLAGHRSSVGRARDRFGWTGRKGTESQAAGLRANPQGHIGGPKCLLRPQRRDGDVELEVLQGLRQKREKNRHSEMATICPYPSYRTQQAQQRHRVWTSAGQASLSRSAIVLNQPNRQPEQAMPLGNGRLGVRHRDQSHPHYLDTVGVSRRDAIAGMARPSNGLDLS